MKHFTKKTFHNFAPQSVIVGALPLAILAGISFSAGASADNNQTINSKELGTYEERYFFHQYANDPIEKRLERIELLVFGQTQGGSNDSRFAKIKQALAKRQESMPDLSAGSKTTTTPGIKQGQAQLDTSMDGQNSNYPMVDKLEWRAMKKTYRGETLDQRLDRLEAKLFGKANPNMPYSDRVDRLRKVTGIDVVVAKPTGPLGPKPKARPRSESDDSLVPQFGQNPLDPSMQDMDNMFNQFGFGGSAPFGNNVIRQQMQQMQQMMRQMQGMQGMQLPKDAVPGTPHVSGFSMTYRLDPNTGKWIMEKQEFGNPQNGQKNGVQPNKAAPNSIGKSIIKQRPGLPQSQLAPGIKAPSKDIPPYYDPNTI
jgi:hypothetical protein